MKYEIFYHICVFAEKNRQDIIIEQLDCIRSSKLFNIIENVNCCIVSQNKNLIEFMTNLIANYGPKFKVIETFIGNNSSEHFTLNCLKKKLALDTSYLYIHSKGVTRPENLCVHDWRRCMEYFLITNAHLYLEKMGEYETMGIFEHPTYSIPHYSGNFWWATGDYLMRLFAQKEIQKDYLGPEMFILSLKPKSLNIYPMKATYNGYFQRLEEKEYCLPCT